MKLKMLVCCVSLLQTSIYSMDVNQNNVENEQKKSEQDLIGEVPSLSLPNFFGVPDAPELVSSLRRTYSEAERYLMEEESRKDRMLFEPVSNSEIVDTSIGGISRKDSVPKLIKRNAIVPSDDEVEINTDLEDDFENKMYQYTIQYHTKNSDGENHKKLLSDYISLHDKYQSLKKIYATMINDNVSNNNKTYVSPVSSDTSDEKSQKTENSFAKEAIPLQGVLEQILHKE